MTMDVQNNYQNYKEQSPDLKETNLNIESAKTLQNTKIDMQSKVINQGKTSKRSFDVAFLMMPDDKMRQTQPDRPLRVSKQLFNTEEWEHQPKRAAEMYKHSEFSNDNTQDLKDQDEERIRINNNMSPGFGSDINIDVGTDEYPTKAIYCSDSDTSEQSRSRPNSNESAGRQPKFLPEYKSKIFDDPTLISMQSKARYENRFLEKSHDMSPKSAFTKVSNFNIRSPNPSVSPDNLLYQNSISPPLSAGSSPSGSFNKTGFNHLLSPAHLLNGHNFFKAHNVPSTSPNYPESSTLHRTGTHFKAMEYHEKQGSKSLQMSPNKMNFLPFRPELPYLQAGPAYPFGVQNFHQPNPDYIKFAAPPREPVNPLIANPAAAILSTLLPSTIAAFSLPAQNVCAKCSISFRMTSDLVYHMRTHHKTEATVDPSRRKREDKLKCPVCNESFRERHHLTRHMTAHQDKEGDGEEVPSQSLNKKSKHFYPNGSSMLHK